MSLSVIPLTILGQITGVSGSGDTVLYQVSFKSIDGTPMYGVTAVWTDEQAEIEALAAQKPYGIWINPIDGTFTVKFAGYTYVGSADLTDRDVLAGVTPIEFANQSGGGSGLPAVTSSDNGKMLQVDAGEWKVKQYPVETVENVYYDDTVTLTSGSFVPLTLEGDYDLDNFADYTVEIDGESATYISSPQAGFVYPSNSVTPIAIGVNNGAVFATTYGYGSGEEHTIKISYPQENIDANFKYGVLKALPAVTEDDEGKQLTVVNGEWSKNGYIYETIDKRDTSVSPNKTYVVHFHRQGKLVRVNCNAIPMSLFTDIVIPQGYRPADAYDGVRQLILNVDDNSVEWVQFDESTNKFNYSGSSTGKFLIDFTYFTYNAFPTE